MRGAEKKRAVNRQHSLNTICPYFTMFPVDFPLRVLGQAPRSAIVLDPFCGRGTTNYAARVLGLRSYGLDTSPVATAIARAKLARTGVDNVVRLAQRLLAEHRRAAVPRGHFWRLAYHPRTLEIVCRLRNGLLVTPSSDDAIVLRAIMLGALHGPNARDVRNSSYFSNQMPRTFAPKPRYATQYWARNRLKPAEVDVVGIIRRRTERALSGIPQSAQCGQIRTADSREAVAYSHIPRGLSHVVTSPPYYGLRTYVEDQWLRNWFIGGPEEVPYGRGTQLSHDTPESFARSLAAVWDNIARTSSGDLKMVVRFGAIGSRRQDPREILKASLAASAATWRVRTIRPLNPARASRRQANHMRTPIAAPPEYDFYITN